MEKAIRNNFSKIEELIGDRTMPTKEEFDYQDYRSFTWHATITDELSDLRFGRMTNRNEKRMRLEYQGEEPFPSFDRIIIYEDMLNLVEKCI